MSPPASMKPRLYMAGGAIPRRQSYNMRDLGREKRGRQHQDAAHPLLHGKREGKDVQSWVRL